MLNAYLRVFLMQMLLYVNDSRLWVLFSNTCRKLCMATHLSTHIHSVARHQVSIKYQAAKCCPPPLPSPKIPPALQQPCLYPTQPPAGHNGWAPFHEKILSSLSSTQSALLSREVHTPMTERESGRVKDLKPQRDHIKEREKELRGQRVKKRGGRGERRKRR